MEHEEIESEAYSAYETAADRAGVVVRDLHSPRELEDARLLCDGVWPTVGGGTQVTSNMLKAIEHAGGYVVAAYSRDGEAVGATLGFIGRHRDGSGAWEPHLHSHMAAVAAGWRDRSVGSAMKRHQRWWAINRGIPVVAWTFDPLVRRNVRLNLVKLGADVAEYLPDFYGEMDDEINIGDPTDRLLAWWRVSSIRAMAAARGDLSPDDAAALRSAGAVDAIRVTPDGPEALSPPSSAQTILVALPEDIVAIRGEEPELALRWRMAVREALHGVLARGGRITGITDDGSYVVRTEVS